jgi:hypothetical protein
MTTSTENNHRMLHISMENTDRSVYSAINKAIGFFESTLDMSIPKTFVPWSDSDSHYKSMEWYVRESLVRNENQDFLSLKRFLELRQEHWRAGEANYDYIVVLEKEAVLGDCMFGGTVSAMYGDGGLADISGCIISLKHIKEWYPDDWKTVFWAVTIHEYGHFLGLHDCGKDCIMNPVDKDRVLGHLRNLKRKDPFCEGHKLELTRGLVRVYLSE